MNICIDRMLSTGSLPIIDFNYFGRTQSAFTYEGQR